MLRTCLWLLIVHGSAMADLPASIMDHLETPPMFKIVMILLSLFVLLLSLTIYCMEAGQSEDGIQFAMFNSQIIRMEHANTEQELTNLENDPQIQDILKNASQAPIKRRKNKRISQKLVEKKEEDNSSNTGTDSQGNNLKDTFSDLKLIKPENDYKSPQKPTAEKQQVHKQEEAKQVEQEIIEQRGSSND